MSSGGMVDLSDIWVTWHVCRELVEWSCRHVGNHGFPVARPTGKVDGAQSHVSGSSHTGGHAQPAVQIRLSKVPIEVSELGEAWRSTNQAIVHREGGESW